ncbi:MAG: protein kinase, partial [Dehalococcoidia bacterium]
MNTSETPMLPLWREGDIILGLYEVRGVVGNGNFGTVHRVYHLGWRKDLAVKSPGAETLANSRYLEVCLDGAHTWANLGVHPNIVTCYYVREIDGIPRICMDYVEGESLGDKLAGVIDLDQALDYAIQICTGMAHAQKHGVIHGDLRPENCFITANGTLKISDFGLGVVEEFAGDVESWMKALQYVAPERWHLGVKVTPAADIFSLGLVLYGMVRGEGQADSMEKAFGAGMVDEVLAYATIPDALSALIKDCLRENPEERPLSFGLLEERLREIYREVTGSSYISENVEAHALQVSDYNKRGASFYDIGLKDDALKSLEDAVRADPSHLDSGYNQSLLRWGSGKMTDNEVIRWLEMKAESHAGEWRPFYLLGLANIARRDAAASEAALKEALKLVSADGKVKTVMEEVEKARDSWPRFLLTLSGHEHAVNSIAISADSRFAISASDDKTLRYWDLLAGECRRILKGHERAVNAVDMSADGRFALSGSDNKTLRYWDLRTGECLRVLTGHDRAVNSVAITPNGGYAVSGGDDKTMRYWDLGKGDCILVLKGHERAVNSVSISADGRFAVSGSDDKTLRCWDLNNGDCLFSLIGHERAVNSVAVSADCRFALSGSDDKTLRYWDLGTGECLRILTGHEDLVSFIAIVSEDRFAFSNSKDKTIRLWELATGACLHTIDRHDRGGISAAVSPDARFAIVCSDDKDLGLWYLGGVESLRLPLVVEQVDKVERDGVHSH